MAVPRVDVSHLASASSFYSAVLQPLGLSYLDDEDLPTSVTYGIDSEPILQIRQNPTPLGPLRLSSLVLTAPSQSAVVGFHDCGLRANPPLLLAGGQQAWLGVDGGVARAALHDLDGNRIEVVYTSSSSMQAAVRYPGTVTRRPHAVPGGACRVLEWNYDIASARPSVTVPSHYSSSNPEHHYQHSQQPRLHRRGHDDAMYHRTDQPLYSLRRSLTHDSAAPSSSTSRAYEPSTVTPTMPSSTRRRELQPEPVQSDSPRQSSLTSGLSTTTVLGALLGVAAGAAVTYGFVSQDRQRKPVQEMDPAPLLPRRSTFPERIASSRRSRYDDGDDYGDDDGDSSVYSEMAYGKPVGKHQARSAVSVYPMQKHIEDSHARRVVSGSHTRPSVDEHHTRSKPSEFRARPDADDYHTRGTADNYPPSRHGNNYPDRSMIYADVADDCADVWSPSTRQVMFGGPSYERSVARTAPRSRAPTETHDISSQIDDTHEARNRHSSRSQTGRRITLRARSETAGDREPTSYVLDGRDQQVYEEQVYAPSRHSAVPRSTPSHVPSRYHRSSHDAEHDTYVSARTHRSASTSRPSRMKLPSAEDPYFEQEPVMRSRAASRISASRPPISGTQVSGRRSSSRPRSLISARDVPLPMSGVGSSHANWDDDTISLAPSDSISCVGSKSSRRTHRY